MRLRSPCTLFALLALFLCLPSVSGQEADPILCEIQELEGRRDPKCCATATRLENFVAGTPLGEQARFAKNLLQKEWMRETWRDASRAAAEAGSGEVGAVHVREALRNRMRVEGKPGEDRTDRFPGGTSRTLVADDIRHYGSVAYSLRALLAVHQETLLSPDPELRPLSDEAVKALKEALDLLTLAVLQECDDGARLGHRYEIDAENLIGFAGVLYLGAQARALERGHGVIREEDVHDFVQELLPHTMNDYEDATFFPALEREERIFIESYDMDAFRDSGLHWTYLQYAIDDDRFSATLEPDPFAVELIAEAAGLGWRRPEDNHPGEPRQPLIADLDNDGLQDLIAGNDFGVNAYFRNQSDGTFQGLASFLGTDKPSYTMGIGLSGLNGDGTPDVYISNIVFFVLPDSTRIFPHYLVPHRGFQTSPIPSVASLPSSR